ncbi:MAG TPA: IS110 family transposase [bacterium]|nr:IS110 family transposase [bacterium]
MQRRSAIKPDTLIVGIDVAKFNHVARTLVPGGAIGRPLEFANSREGFAALSAEIEARKPTPASAVIVGLESTGVYWINLARWLAEQGYQVVQVSGLYVHRAKELADNSRGTSDGKDALLIADLVAQGKYLGFVRPAGVLADLRQLVGLRQRLVQERAARCNLLHQSVDLLFPEFPTVFKDVTGPGARRVLRRFPAPAAALVHPPDEMRRQLAEDGRVRVSVTKLAELQALARQSIGAREWTTGLQYALNDTLLELDSLDTRVKQVEAEINRLLAQVDETPILTSLVGPMTTAIILGETGGLKQYSCAAAVLKLAGLNLYQISSGRYCGDRHISQMGRPLLRQALYLAVLQHTHPGMPLYPYYAELLRRGKPKPVALVALCCRLVRLLYALVRDGRCYSPRPLGNNQQTQAA